MSHAVDSVQLIVVNIVVVHVHVMNWRSVVNVYQQNELESRKINEWPCSLNVQMNIMPAYDTCIYLQMLMTIVTYRRVNRFHKSHCLHTEVAITCTRHGPSQRSAPMNGELSRWRRRSLPVVGSFVQVVLSSLPTQDSAPMKERAAPMTSSAVACGWFDCVTWCRRCMAAPRWAPKML